MIKTRIDFEIQPKVASLKSRHTGRLEFSVRPKKNIFNKSEIEFIGDKSGIMDGFDFFSEIKKKENLNDTVSEGSKMAA